MKVLLAAADVRDGRLASKFVKTWLPSGKGSVFVVHVVEPPGILSDLNRPIFSSWTKQAMTKARRLVGGLAQALASRHLRTRPVVRQGNVKPTLLQLIADEKIELTVMAPHASSGLRRFLLGSVSETVLQNSSTSVAIARAPRPSLRPTILAGIDGSVSAQKAAQWVLKARLPKCRIVLMHIEEPPDTILDRMSRVDAELPPLLIRGQAVRRRRVQHSLERTGTRLKKQGHSVETVITDGLPAPKILSLAERYTADLIVLGRRGLGCFEGYSLGSVSREVARHARCSVVIVK